MSCQLRHPFAEAGSWFPVSAKGWDRHTISAHETSIRARLQSCRKTRRIILPCAAGPGVPDQHAFGSVGWRLFAQPSEATLAKIAHFRLFPFSPFSRDNSGQSTGITIYYDTGSHIAADRSYAALRRSGDEILAFCLSGAGIGDCSLRLQRPVWQRILIRSSWFGIRQCIRLPGAVYLYRG